MNKASGFDSVSFSEGDLDSEITRRKILLKVCKEVLRWKISFMGKILKTAFIFNILRTIRLERLIFLENKSHNMKAGSIVHS